MALAMCHPVDKICRLVTASPSCCYQAFEPQFGLDWERDMTTAAMDNSGVI
ncbi:hypothetical protein CGLO_10981 [Colletotrichum gloeosporioides Cg-14]|uniref:Uncharacterized protein n=1 Tax=Colletotrichum gloeosporioides (strain Cg-14) TaxID=1237896 RepID=T0KC30_COLGC|nr:hypothetical protein CGLO_10981 [Colletotrichum gloeosporioides Cg-14]